VRAFIPLLLFALAFALLILLPARMRNREMRRVAQVQDALTVGTEVMTSSGLYGRVVGIDAGTVELEVAPGVVTTWAKAAIREVPQLAGEPGGELPGGAEAEARRPDADPG